MLPPRARPRGERAGLGPGDKATGTPGADNGSTIETTIAAPPGTGSRGWASASSGSNRHGPRLTLPTPSSVTCLLTALQHSRGPRTSLDSPPQVSGQAQPPTCPSVRGGLPYPGSLSRSGPHAPPSLLFCPNDTCPAPGPDLVQMLPWHWVVCHTPYMDPKLPEVGAPPGTGHRSGSRNSGWAEDSQWHR